MRQYQRQIYVQQYGRRVRRQPRLTDGRGQQHGLPSDERLTARIAFERHRPLQHGENVKPLIATDDLGIGKRPTVEHELLANDQLLDVRPDGRLRRLRTHRTTLVVDHGQAFADVQGTRIAVRSNTIPIEQPKGRVTGLLDLSDDQSGP